MSKNPANSRILLIESNPVHAKNILDALETAGNGRYDVEWVTHLHKGLERLGRGGLEAVLTELSLPDSQGIETLERLLPLAPEVPVLVLGAGPDPEIAAQIMK